MSYRRTVQVYVEGFALYKALLQRAHPEHRWLDLRLLSERLFPNRDVVGVKYFTAPLKPLTGNPGIGQRQQVYWRALRTTGVEIVEGRFVFNRQFLPKHPEEVDDAGRVITVQVKRPEEKGTDVALATHLIVDAFGGVAESSAIVTNDSDLVPPVLALTERGYPVSLVSVMGPSYNKAFAAAGVESIRQIREGMLAASHLPDRVQDAAGKWIHKPPSWT